MITLQFVLSLDIDVAEQEVQAAINAAQNYLPANLPMPPVYTKTNPADAPILTLALTSQSHCLVESGRPSRHAAGAKDLAARRRGRGHHQRRTETGRAHSGQSHELASYGLNLEDLRTALTATSLDSAKGSFDGPSQGYQIGANDQLLTAQDYKRVVVAYKNNAPVILPGRGQRYRWRREQLRRLG